ncbi:hypothetical protein FE257_000023 [Aspergillus nanangensis]|uniref:Uncharacterized protein n=1 Tax=Aspergillus nanangensis TaxID=2582783 RepID=A0AAD4GZM5_ASPNN|nr:hypothetical protein FE257_000023 [Aspergillus nanangensis]
MSSNPPPSSDEPLLTPGHELDRTVPPSPLSQETRSVSSADSTTEQKKKALTPRRRWIPLALRRGLFVALALLFVAFFVVVEVLFQYSNRNDGLSTNSSTNHYLWTYGPTAVFILISAVWGQIEYRTKQLMPWAALTATAETPRKSILLDYISWWNVIALFKASRARHWPVVIVILGSLMLQLMTVASTGLLTLERVKLDHVDTTPLAQAVFDATSFSPHNADGRSAFTTVGIGWLDLAYPPGTSAEHAFQPFNVSQNVQTSPDSLIRADVDVFTPQMDCEWGNVVQNATFCADRACVTTSMELTITADSCRGAYLATLHNDQAAARGYFGDVQQLACNDTAAGEDADRLMFITAHWVDTEKTDQLQTLSCRPKYTMSRQLVTIDTAGQAKDFQPSLESSTPPAKLATQNQSSLAAMDLSAGVLSGIDQSSAPFLMLSNPKTQDMQGGHFGAFFHVANLTFPHSGNEWLDRDIMEEGVQRTFKALMVQTARQELMRPVSQPLVGFLSASRDRLIVRELSVRLMEASLVVLVVICAGMWFLRPVYCTPRDPGSILGQIIVLDRSPELAQTVAGITTQTKLVQATQGKLYKGGMVQGLHDTPVWSINELPSLGDKNEQPPEVEHKKEKKKTKKKQKNEAQKPPGWWQPWTFNRFGRTLALASPLLLIIGLELVYQLSHRWDGLGAVGANEYLEYTWVYLPAALMMAVRIVYEGIFSSAKVVQPYLHLRRGARIEDDAITDNAQAKLAVQSVFTALTGNFGVAPAALATLVAPLLTIVASGLYSAEDIQAARNTRIERADLFNTAIADAPSVLDTAVASLLGGLIVTSGVAYPRWTYDELALSALRPATLFNTEDNVAINESSIAVSSNNTSSSPSSGASASSSSSSTDISSSSTNNTSFLQLQAPALRATLHCTPVPPSANLTLQTTTDDIMQLAMNLDPRCTVSDRTRQAAYLPGHASVGHSFGMLQGIGENGSPCDDTFVAFGYLPDAHSLAQVHAYTCFTSIDLLSADTTFLLPNYTIASAVPDESTSSRAIPRYRTFYDTATFLPTRNDSSAGYDSLFTAVTTNRGVEESDLVHNPDKVLTTVEHIYRQLMAQSLSAQARVSLNSTTTTPDNTTTRPSGVDTLPVTLKGTFVDPNVTRLKQSAVSSRILEGVLAVMWLSCVVSFHFLRTRDLLPLNPCSIAGAVSYLARSQLVGEGIVPAGAETQRKADLLRDSRLKGLMLSLGW